MPIRGRHPRRRLRQVAKDALVRLMPGSRRFAPISAAPRSRRSGRPGRPARQEIPRHRGDALRHRWRGAENGPGDRLPGHGAGREPPGSDRAGRPDAGRRQGRTARRPRRDRRQPPGQISRRQPPGADPGADKRFDAAGSAPTCAAPASRPCRAEIAIFGDRRRTRPAQRPGPPIRDRKRIDKPSAGPDRGPHGPDRLARPCTDARASRRRRPPTPPPGCHDCERHEGQRRHAHAPSGPESARPGRETCNEGKPFRLGNRFRASHGAAAFSAIHPAMKMRPAAAERVQPMPGRAANPPVAGAGGVPAAGAGRCQTPGHSSSIVPGGLEVQS